MITVSGGERHRLPASEGSKAEPYPNRTPAGRNPKNLTTCPAKSATFQWCGTDAGAPTQTSTRPTESATRNMTDYEPTEADGSERLDPPVKVRWTGYARSRITEYNGDFSDDNCGDDHFYRPSMFVAANTRQKTQVVCVTVGEAASVRYELQNYRSDQRTWMNGSMDKSLIKASRKLDEAMAERGYEAVIERDSWGHRSFQGYERVETDGGEEQGGDHTGADDNETMSDNTNTQTVSIDSKNDFIAQVKETGVVVAGGDKVLHTEGEGRATRYFVGGEQVKKADIEAEFEAQQSDDDPAVEVHVPTQAEHEHGEIECEYCGRSLGYLTGSHMASHDGGPQTVDAYRHMVAERRDIEPEDVPLAPEELSEAFESWGNSLDEEVRQKLSDINKARWEAGEYDHLRKEEADTEPTPAIVRVEAEA